MVVFKLFSLQKLVTPDILGLDLQIVLISLLNMDVLTI